MKLNTRARSVYSFLVMSVLALGLQACGGGDDPAPTTTVEITTDQDGSGIYSGTATVDVNTNITDLRGMVYNNRFMFFSETANPHVLYDGTVTSVSLDDYTATVDVYENGVKTQTGVAVTGKVISATSITGTIGTAGDTGNHNGSFSLTYDSVYERGATVERIEATGFNQTTGATYSLINSVTDGYEIRTDFYFGVASSFCPISGEVYAIPDSSVNIYTIDNIDINDSVVNDCLIKGSGYAGMASVIDDSVDGIDSRILIAYTNGTNSVFGLLTKP